MISMRRECFSQTILKCRCMIKKNANSLGINHEMFQGCYKEAYQCNEIRAIFLVMNFLFALFDQLLAGLDSICGCQWWV